MKRLMHILKGWGKSLGFINISTAEQKLSDLRLNHCKACDCARQTRSLNIIRGRATYENSLICTVCGCPCKEKSLVIDEVCPIGKW